MPSFHTGAGGVLIRMNNDIAPGFNIGSGVPGNLTHVSTLNNKTNVFIEPLPSPLARSGHSGAKKTPKTTQAGNAQIKKIKNNLVIRTKGSRKFTKNNRSEAKVHDLREEPGRESLMSTRSDVFGVLKSSKSLNIQRTEDENDGGGKKIKDEVIQSGKLKDDTENALEPKYRSKNISSPDSKLIFFTDPDRVLEMIKSSRMQKEKLYFYVPETVIPPFEMYYSFPLNNVVIHDEDIIFFQSFCEGGVNALKEINCSKKENYRLAGSVNFAMTISALWNESIPKAGLTAKKILQPDSFKLVEYHGRHEDFALLLVWYRHREHRTKGSKAAITEISYEDHKYKLTDENTGYKFSSDNINDFIAGIERVTGLTYDSGMTVDHTPGISIRKDLEFNIESHFFIGVDKTPGQGNNILDLKIDESKGLFSSVEAAAKQKSDLIYRSCFKFIGNNLHYIDNRGDEGKIIFKAHERRPALVKLNDNDITLDFLIKKGVKKGFYYSKSEISSMLTDYGLTEIKNNMTEGYVAPRLDNFYILLP